MPVSLSFVLLARVCAALGRVSSPSGVGYDAPCVRGVRVVLCASSAISLLSRVAPPCLGAHSCSACVCVPPSFVVHPHLSVVGVRSAHGLFAFLRLRSRCGWSQLLRVGSLAVGPRPPSVACSIAPSAILHCRLSSAVGARSAPVAFGVLFCAHCPFDSARRWAHVVPEVRCVWPASGISSRMCSAFQGVGASFAAALLGAVRC
eukprot:9478270-Pyramimonas_sp.AAC.1